jgi:basic amino acid/polyamine antiporter, APA family
VTTAPDHALVRALGRRDLTAFAINRVIGGGIFGIPAVLYAGVGPLSILAILLAGLVVLCITLCFAEVGSRYDATGGPYLYAYDTFGPIVGFEVGWLMWVTQLGGFAAVTNLFVNYVGWFAPEVMAGPWRLVIITALVALLTTVNILGVRRAATVNNLLTLAKLVPLALFVLVGLFYIDGSLLVPPGPPTAAAISGGVLLAIYAFSGFEVLGVPSGEVRDPSRTIPFALLAGLGIVALVYIGVQVVAVGTLPGLGASARPLADAAERVFGRPGALLMVLGALLSTLGVAHAILLAAGRMPFAMAERKQLPAGIAAVHPRFRTPHVGLLVSAAGMLLFTVATTFTSAVTITVGLRVIIYIVTCAALPVLRRRPESAPGPFSAPTGSALAVVSVLIATGLLASRPWADIIQLVAVLAVGVMVWVGVARPARR